VKVDGKSFRLGSRKFPLKELLMDLSRRIALAKCSLSVKQAERDLKLIQRLEANVLRSTTRHRVGFSTS
jgi:hypothetical protein